MFVRQNRAEIEEIPSELIVIAVAQTPVERALYLKLEQQLRGQDMRIVKTGKSKRSQITTSFNSRRAGAIPGAGAAAPGPGYADREDGKIQEDPHHNELQWSKLDSRKFEKVEQQLRGQDMRIVKAGKAKINQAQASCLRLLYNGSATAEEAFPVRVSESSRNRRDCLRDHSHISSSSQRTSVSQDTLEQQLREQEAARPEAPLQREHDGGRGVAQGRSM
ncbi:MAG: hypothetical protein Q9191_007652 [Dirinaria sp. TL-2023a]